VSAAGGTGKVYVVDTSVWVNFNDEHKLTKVLAQLAPHAQRRCIVAISKVLDELKRRWPHVHKEVKKLPVSVKASVEQSQEIVMLAGELLHKYRILGSPLTPHNRADPWIVAAAKVHNWTVVTDEGSGRRPNRSMKGVCKLQSVDCIDRIEFVRQLKVDL
jgi:predicted nucleic acid-binding protein